MNNNSCVYYKGSKWKSNNFGEFEIIDFHKISKRHRYFKCKFLDGTIVIAQESSIKKGQVKNPNHPNVFGVGFIGQGEYNCVNSAYLYRRWINIIQRCYDKNYHNIHDHYKDCTVCERWHNFQNFCEDIINMLKKLNIKLSDFKDYVIDKDMKVCGNKFYSPDTITLTTKSENSKESRSRNYEKLLTLTGLTYIGESPDGKIYEFENQSKFCEEHELNKSHVNSCIKGNRKNIKVGFLKLRRKNNVEEYNKQYFKIGRGER